MSLSNAEIQKDSWDFSDGVGFIGKKNGCSCDGSGSTKDKEQDIIIQSNTTKIQQNEVLDQKQQEQINENATKITQIENEMPTLEIENTTLVVGKKEG